MMKKLIPITIGAILITTFYLYNKINKSKDGEMIESGQWTTFQHNKEKKNTLSSHKSTDKELESINVIRGTDKELKKIDPPIKSDKILYKNRVVLKATRSFNINDFPEGFVNKISPNWKEITAKKLLKFQDKNTKVFIKRERGVIILKKNRPMFAEQVVITYKLDSDYKNSFRAFVDSEHGTIISIWDRSKSEDFTGKYKIRIPLPKR